MKNHPKRSIRDRGIECYFFQNIAVPKGLLNEIRTGPGCAFGKPEKKQNFLGSLTGLEVRDISLLEHLVKVPGHPEVGV